jgi:hypothetical protein
MSYDKRYYGIYEGFVQDFDDPENNGRVRLTVPQVTGEVEWTGWAPNAGGGSISQINYPYGTFLTTANQTVSAANTATVVNNWVEGDANKTYLNGTRLYVEESGDYMFLFSTVFTKNGGSLTTADMWLRKNGVNLEDSNTRVTISGNNAETLMTVSFILDLDAGDYIELVFSSPESSTKLTYFAASTGPTRPAMPGVIATLNLIGKYKPQPGQRVWVMYIAGDPNFPVWMGAQA